MRKMTITYPVLLSLFLLIICASVSFAADSGMTVTQQWLEESAVDDSRQIMQAFQRGEGKPLEHSVFQLGNTPKQIAVLITVTNQTQQAVSMHLLAGVPYSRFLQATLLPLLNRVPGVNTDQKPGSLLIDEDENRSFHARNNRFRLLNSDSFSVPAGAARQVLVQTLVEGPSYLPFSLLTGEEFTRLELNDSVFAALFYGFTMTLGALFLLFSLAVRHRVAILYAGLFLLGLLAMADIDGHAFQWLWPDYPRWNHFSPLIVLPLLNALGFIIIQQLLSSVETPRLQWLKSLALLLAGVSLFVPLLLTVLPFSSVVQLENMLSVPAFLLQPIAFTAWLHLGRRSIASLFALSAIALVITGMVLLVFINVTLPDWLLAHIHHAAYLVVSLMVMSMITVQLMGLHKDQQESLQRELVLAQENAQVNQALLTAEQNYSRARHLALKHKQQLASASHDLRQPIVSLRSAIDAIANRQSAEVRKQLHNAFDYLEQLCNQHLRQTRPESETTAVGGRDSEATHVVQKTDAYPASLILGTVQRMFAREAAERGIELRKVDCSVMLEREPLVVMRIVSNLVANAIKHHSGGERARVVIGCRRQGNSLKFLICDNGAGMSAADIKRLQQPYQKGDESEGEGLGLAIIQQLATDNHIELHIHSELQRGSCFSVILQSKVTR
ncbi:MAG: sensor histidine kinase [Thiolinea sp.]